MKEDDASLLAGVDTGGTYTDAALIDGATHEVRATAKALTKYLKSQMKADDGK